MHHLIDQQKAHHPYHLAVGTRPFLVGYPADAEEERIDVLRPRSPGGLIEQNEKNAETQANTPR